MNSISKVVNTIDKKANNYLSFLDNKYIRTSILTFLGIYIAIWSPRLPKSMNYLFKNNAFRVVIFSLALFISTKDLGVSLMISIAFLISMITLRKYSLMEVAEVVEEKQLEESEELINEIEENVILEEPFPNDKRRNNKVLYYNNNQVDYDNDTTTLERHIYDNNDEAPGFLDNVDNNGIKESSGSNEIKEHENERRNSVDNKEDYEDYREVVVGAPLHLDNEHNSAQGLQNIGGMEGKNIGSWFQH